MNEQEEQRWECVRILTCSTLNRNCAKLNWATRMVSPPTSQSRNTSLWRPFVFRPLHFSHNRIYIGHSIERAYNHYFISYRLRLLIIKTDLLHHRLTTPKAAQDLRPHILVQLSREEGFWRQDGVWRLRFNMQASISTVVLGDRELFCGVGIFWHRSNLLCAEHWTGQHDYIPGRSVLLPYWSTDHDHHHDHSCAE